MNKAKLKAYAPQARKDFIAAVTARAHQIGLAEKNGSVEIAHAEKSGDFVIIAGQSWPAKISQQRANLITRIEKEGFTQTMEAVAYTWFNRFAALRYMEIHDYLSHGYRALSSREGGLPEILNVATELAQNGGLPGLNAQRVIDLKLAGDKDGELYRLTLIAQCNALAKVMPFLFERIDNETELLLPDNLLLTDSVIAKLVEAIPEEDWQEVEIVGWLYQFYISEKKDQVIGKVVKSEDIPAATQLFTPNWIVKYLVQNSVGRLWLMANPASLLKSDWPYYIEPAEQTPEVQAQLDALIQSRMAEDGGSLNPETITVIDPACGSGHILVEAYEVLKAIYLERGYQLRNIPRLILEKNIYGLDIDDRAAQLAGFALLMKARADDRRLFDNSLKLNVFVFQESKGLEADELAQALPGYDALTQPTIALLIDTFANAKTFGSLIQIPPDLNARLLKMDASLQLAVQNGDLLAQEAALNLLPLVGQAQILSMQFDAVVANPPYLASKAMSGLLKEFIENNLAVGKGDLFAAFFLRCRHFLKEGGSISFMTPFTWMFLSSYEPFRRFMIEQLSLTSLIHPEYHSIWDSAAVPICAFSARKSIPSALKATFIDLSAVVGAEYQAQLLRDNRCNKSWSNRYDIELTDFTVIPRVPFAYSLSDQVKFTYKNGQTLGKYCSPKQGIKTGENNRFLRLWHEVSFNRIATPNNSDDQANKKWFICTKGGDFRRWYGNLDYVLNWERDGHEIRNFTDENGKLRSRPQNIEWFFKEGASWSTITSSHLSMRYFPKGLVFESKGSVCFPLRTFTSYSLLALMNSSAIGKIVSKISPTIDYSEGALASLPVVDFDHSKSDLFGQSCVAVSKVDWNSYETSWGYEFSWASNKNHSGSLSKAWAKWYGEVKTRSIQLLDLEEQNNRLFIEAYGLQDELSPEVSEAQITLARADREKDSQRLISYAIGCMMGRYSLDEPGLIYAHAGNVDFDPNRYNTFPADADGIVPITDELWFVDDAANRINEFLLAVWDAETLEENRAWLAESLGQKGNESPQETIRRYIAGSFYKNHLQTYKKRRFTGCSPAANKERFRLWFTCTVTTKVRYPECEPNTLCL